MIQTVRVQTVIGPDLTGEGVLSEIRSTLGRNDIQKVETAKVYRLEGVGKREAKILAEKLFCEEINQTYKINKPILNSVHLGGVVKRHPRGVNPVIVEIAYKPGVMNPEVASIIKSAKDLGIKLIAVDSSREYGFYGPSTHSINTQGRTEWNRSTTSRRAEIEGIVQRLNLLNPLIEQIVQKEPKTLLIKGQPGKTKIIPIRNLSDGKLLLLSQDRLFLNIEEMKVIQNYFRKIKRDPTDCEIETIAQTWSEHSGHKTFKAKIIIEGKDLPAGRQEKPPLIVRIQKEALKHNKHIVSAFIDNSGVMDFYDGWAINGKVETHNSPSAIEPYGGAMTGSGGVFRDIVGTGRGAKNVVSTDIFCLGPWDLAQSELPPGCLPPAYILKRVIAAVRDYGNRMGIPTNNGSLHFHKDFRAKPTVLVGAYGILPKKYAKKGKPQVGDIIVSIGGRVGRDGIHGATFSSGEMTERTITVNAQAVQIGNAIEEKRTFDAILEARDKKLIRAIQDSGGGGLSSAIGEMGQDIGVSVQLKNERVKYQGLAPWEIWLSESQERMIVAIPKNKVKEFEKICQKYNVESSVLGTFDGSKRLKVNYGRELVCDLDMKFLHHGLPQKLLSARGPATPFPPASARSSLASSNALRAVGSPSSRVTPRFENEWTSILEKVLSHGNVCSKEPIVRLYDHNVQGTNALHPFGGVGFDGPNDAVVIRPLIDKPYGMIVSHGLNPILNKIDPYWGSIWAGAEAVANYVAVGGRYQDASLINNYIWPFPDEESLWSLDRSVDAVCDFMKTLKIPVISGKDSLSSTYRGKDGPIIKIPPVLCMAVFGKIPDVAKTVSSDFKKIGSTIVLVGKPDIEGMGGSVYLDITNNSTIQQFNNIPHVDLKLLPKVLNSVHKAIKTGKVLSCHDVSEGGLITSIFEMCVGGGMGVVLRLRRTSGVNARPDYFLFNETAGTFIIEVENKETARNLFKNVPHIILGQTKKEQVISVQNLFDVDLKRLKKVWQKPMREIFN